MMNVCEVITIPRNKYPEETVKIILDAALELFHSKGYEQTTILDIVGAMGGLTRGAFYHHFKSKEEVLFALNARMFRDFNPYERVREMKNLNGLEKIKWVLKAFASNKDYYELQSNMLPLFKSPAILKQMIDSQRDYTARKFAELMEEGNRDGSIRASNPKLLAELFTLLTNIWLIPSIYPCATETEVWQKLDIIKTICESLGLPVLDEEIIKAYKETNYLTS